MPLEWDLEQSQWVSISAGIKMALLVLTASVLFSQDSDSNSAKSLPTAQQVIES